MAFQDPAATVKRFLPKLPDEGTEVVVLSHLGLGREKVLAEAVEGIDVIVGGHSHNRMAEAERVGNTLIVQAGALGSDLGRLDLTIESGKITGHRRPLILLDHATVPADPDAEKLLDRRTRPHRKALDEVVGKAGGWRVRAQTLAGQEARKRDQEPPVDSLFADILRAETKADVALRPGVGYGVAIPPGPVTAAQLRQMVPHEGKGVTLRLTGAQVVEVLGQAAENVFTDEARVKVGGMVQASGLRFSYDPRRAKGQRVWHVERTDGGWDMTAAFLVVTNSIAPCTCPAAPSPRTNRSATVPPVGGTISPQRPVPRLDNHGYSPAAWRLIAEAAGRLGSSVDAAFALGLVGLPLSPQHVRTLAREVGVDLARQRDARAGQGRRRVPVRVAQSPELVAVEVDGGRLRTRAPATGPGVHEQENKEDKFACLVTLKGEISARDPQPEPPPPFLQPRRVERLVRQMAWQAGSIEETSADAPPVASAEVEETAAVSYPAAEPWAPQKRLRTCVASMADSTAFGRMVAVEAQERDFYRAQRQAFVADGAGYNWTLQRTHFADFEPIVDFLHVLCYVYAAARAVRPTAAERWDQYVAWLRACWQAQAQDVVADPQTWQGRVGLPPPGRSCRGPTRGGPCRRG